MRSAIVFAALLASAGSATAQQQIICSRNTAGGQTCYTYPPAPTSYPAAPGVIFVPEHWTNDAARTLDRAQQPGGFVEGFIRGREAARAARREAERRLHNEEKEAR